MIITGHETEFRGPHGRAFLIPWAEDPEATETVCSWLLTAPLAHPRWAQYMLGVVRRQLADATHELFVVALNPQHGPFTVAKMLSYQHTQNMPYLLPVNIAHQADATDDEARLLAAYGAVAVVGGLLCPETSNAPERIRTDWTITMARTLAHIRGEEHAP